MPHVRRFGHVGITVADLDAVTAFFAAPGLGAEWTFWASAPSHTKMDGPTSGDLDRPGMLCQR